MPVLRLSWVIRPPASMAEITVSKPFSFSASSSTGSVRSEMTKGKPRSLRDLASGFSVDEGRTMREISCPRCYSCSATGDLRECPGCRVHNSDWEYCLTEIRSERKVLSE